MMDFIDRFVRIEDRIDRGLLQLQETDKMLGTFENLGNSILAELKALREISSEILRTMTTVKEDLYKKGL